MERKGQKHKSIKFKFFILSFIVVFVSVNQDLSIAAERLITSGNKIVSFEGGAVFRGRGANIFDTRLNNAGAYSQPNVAEVNRRTDELVDTWGVNFLRLCLESYASLNGRVHGLNVLNDPGYVDDIVEIVNHIGTKENVYVLLSIWISPTLDSNGWPTAQTIEEWELLARKFANHDYVMFGICNEPQANYNGALNSQVWARMNNAVAAIRAIEAELNVPKHIIAVQGTGGWARHLQYYITNPITAGGGENIAYEVHVYDPESTFNNRFITPSQTLPVIIGEFGPASSSATMSLDDCQALMDKAQQLDIPYLAWSFHHRSPPSLLVDYTSGGPGYGMNLVPTQWGNLLKDQLSVPWGDQAPNTPSNVSILDIH